MVTLSNMRTAQGAQGDNPGRKNPPAGDIPGGRAVFYRQFPKFPEPSLRE